MNSQSIARHSITFAGHRFAERRLRTQTARGALVEEVAWLLRREPLHRRLRGAGRSARRARGGHAQSIGRRASHERLLVTQPHHSQCAHHIGAASGEWRLHLEAGQDQFRRSGGQ